MAKSTSRSSPTKRSTKPISEGDRFHIIRDTREQPGQGWRFISSPKCSGMTVATLKTGDYSIQGLENIVCVERKGSVNEFANNLVQPRFERELERMAEFKVAAVVLEFSLEDLLAWPRRAGLSPAQQARIRNRGPYLLKLLLAMMGRHPATPFFFADSSGQELTLALFKQAWADHKPLQSPAPKPA